jgi:hypothetical protein
MRLWSGSSAGRCPISSRASGTHQQITLFTVSNCTWHLDKPETSGPEAFCLLCTGKDVVPRTGSSHPLQEMKDTTTGFLVSVGLIGSPFQWGATRIMRCAAYSIHPDTRSTVILTLGFSCIRKRDFFLPVP